MRALRWALFAVFLLALVPPAFAARARTDSSARATRGAPRTTHRPDRLAHTFSIVARDSTTGDLGVAVQSHYFAVGASMTSKSCIARLRRNAWR